MPPKLSNYNTTKPQVATITQISGRAVGREKRGEARRQAGTRIRRPANTLATSLVDGAQTPKELAPLAPFFVLLVCFPFLCVLWFQLEPPTQRGFAWSAKNLSWFLVVFTPAWLVPE